MVRDLDDFLGGAETEEELEELMDKFHSHGAEIRHSQQGESGKDILGRTEGLIPPSRPHAIMNQLLSC